MPTKWTRLTLCFIACEPAPTAAPAETAGARRPDPVRAAMLGRTRTRNLQPGCSGAPLGLLGGLACIECTILAVSSVIRQRPHTRWRPCRVASGFASARARSAISSNFSRVKPSSRSASLRAVRLALRNQHRRARFGEKARVVRLVVVDRRGKRHQNARHAGGRQLRDGERAGAADDQIGLGVARGHVVDERQSVRPAHPRSA